MRSNYKRIGQFVRQVNNRNTELAVVDLKGISINKLFMPSVANINGTDLSTYKVVKTNQFAYNPMHVGRDEVLPIGMLEAHEPVIVSPAYVVFEIVDPEALLPEYLMMWCRRPEFDRNAWFTTDSSVRGGFNWDDFCDMTLPVPHPDKQREIVREYNTIVKRIKLNEQLTQKLEETAQALYKQWFVDFEFPISKEYAESIGKPELEGNPYKSSSGVMVFNEKLNQEIPEDWDTCQILDLFELQRGFDLPVQNRLNGDIPIYAANGLTGFHNEAKVKGVTVITGRSGTIGNVFYVPEDSWPLNTTLWIKSFKIATPTFAFYILKNIELKGFHSGSAVPTLNRNDIHVLLAIKPPRKLIDSFERHQKVVFRNLKITGNEIEKLTILKEILLAKITKLG